jgi:hypothetical protein
VAKAKRKKPTPETLRELFLKSGNQCAFPGCSHLMMNKEGVFIGQVCHIEAAEEGGERFNENMTDDERAAFPNLMLMCYPHHQVTNDVDAYPVPRLQAMKADHEAKFADVARAMEDGYDRQVASEGGINQQGSGNKAIAGSHNSGNQIIGHGNTIIQGLSGTAADPFADLDEVMGDFLDDLQGLLREQPTWRDVVIIEAGTTPGNISRAFAFREDDYPDLHSWADLLEQRGLASDATKGGYRRIRMGHEFVKFLGAKTQSTPRLSDRAARLLVNAASGDGMVMLILSSKGLSVQAGTLNLEIPHDQPRIQAAWKAAGQELLKFGFTQYHGSDEMFELTQAGWEAVERLAPETAEAMRRMEGS